MLYERTYMAQWFPHIPLALAVAAVGILELLPWLGPLQDIWNSISISEIGFETVLHHLNALKVDVILHALIGTLLLMLSLGLVRRSRLAWVLSLLLMLGILILQHWFDTEPNRIFTVFTAVLLGLMAMAGNSFQRLSLTANTLFAVVSMLIAMGYGVFGSYILGQDFNPPITDLKTALYFSVVTISTVGYGEITPHSSDARMFTLTLIVLGIAIFATSITVIAATLINEPIKKLLQPKGKRMKRKSHVIITGNNPLSRSAIRALESRNIPVTVIWDARPSDEIDLPKDLLIGDSSDVEVLRRADGEDARAVLALSQDDSENAFVALAAKDVNAAVHTVVAVNDAHNIRRVKFVKPDAILTLPLIGGELLAMMLSGEKIDADLLIDKLLHLGNIKEKSDA
jgi:voltage-gated potassium channel